MEAEKNKIYIGSLDDPLYYFDNDSIEQASIAQAVALVGQELSIDTFNPIVADSIMNTMTARLFRSSNGKVIEGADGSLYALDVEENPEATAIIRIPDGTPVWYYHEDELVGKFYLESVKRLAKNRYQLYTVSAIGSLDHMYHGGGLFQVSTFGAVLRHILASGLHGDGAPVIDYVIDDDVAELTVSGWLPYASKRNNLYQLIFAYGVNIVKNTDGNPRFTFVYTARSAATNIADSAIFYGGNVEYTRPYSGVSIMEHTYSAITADTDPVLLYDNSESGRVADEEIWFDQAPVIVSTLETSAGLSIISATENSAVISGNGKLTGIPYTHTTRTVFRENESGESEKTVSVNDCTMVNVINSENLLARLFAFYCPHDFIKLIKNDVIYTGQRCGKSYKFTNPHGEQEIAFLASMDINASSFSRASCEFYADYNPAGQAGLYQNCILLDKATFAEDGGVFTVPEGVTQMKVVLIGGGTGGQSGWPGENGKDAYTHTNVASDGDISGMWYGAEGGAGGEAGSGGDPGRVLEVTIENPAASYAYTIGEGGEGGAATGFIPDTAEELKTTMEHENPDHEYTAAEIAALLAQEEALTDWSGEPNPGADGSATTFGSYSTDDEDGYVPSGGVYNPIYGEYYALKGNPGVAGGHGGARKVEGKDGVYNWVTDGESVEGYAGGRTGQALTSVAGLPEAKLTAYGGNGAGAAVGLDRAEHVHMDGGSDQTATWEVVTDGT